jgi:hypothetical protein
MKTIKQIAFTITSIFIGIIVGMVFNQFTHKLFHCIYHNTTKFYPAWYECTYLHFLISIFLGILSILALFYITIKYLKL